MGLELGDIYGGPEHEHSAMREISHRLYNVKETYHDKIIPARDGSLAVVFQYPGSVLEPEFRGIRPGRLSKRQKNLLIQVAVPKEMMGPEVFGKFYVDALEEAVRMGKKYFEKNKIPFSEESHLALVNKLREALGQRLTNRPTESPSSPASTFDISRGANAVDNTLADVKNIFAEMKREGSMDPSAPLKWGHFFLNSDLDALWQLYQELRSRGYEFESCHSDREGFVLQVSKIEARSAQKLHRENIALKRLAEENGIDEYDGWDVGRPEDDSG
jgi:hypothetical protein